MSERRYWNESIETLSGVELRRLQQEKLQRQLTYVSHRSAFYRERWAGSNMDPKEDVRRLEDLPLLPFTTKDDLRQSQRKHPPYGNYLACDPEDIVIICASSGTTGKPVYMPLTLYDQERWAEILCRIYWTWGVRPHDVIAHLASFHMFTSGLPVYPATLKLGAAIIPIGAQATIERALLLMQDLKPTAMALTASFALYLTRQVRAILRIEPHELGIRTLATGAEPLLQQAREELNEAWRLHVYNMGGMGEFCTALWSECHRHDGLHFLAGDYVYPELIQPDSGESLDLAEGAEGEFVFTSLDRFASPLVRFRTGDQVQIVSTERCECGRTGFRFELRGRTDDMLKVRGARVWVSAIRDIVSEFRPRTTGYAQVVLNQPGISQPAPLHVDVEYGASVEPHLLPDLKREIEATIASRLVVKTDVRLVPEETIERTSMKYKYIRYEPTGG